MTPDVTMFILALKALGWRWPRSIRTTLTLSSCLGQTLESRLWSGRKRMKCSGKWWLHHALEVITINPDRETPGAAQPEAATPTRAGGTNKPGAARDPTTATEVTRVTRETATPNRTAPHTSRATLAEGPGSREVGVRATPAAAKTPQNRRKHTY